MNADPIIKCVGCCRKTFCYKNNLCMACYLKRLEVEVERLNKMRVHCTRCGADYLATGVEAGCPCALQSEVERLRAMVLDQGKRMCDYCDLECSTPCKEQRRYIATGRGEGEG